MANTLSPYFGEFLASPIPLELSLVEPCDYGCQYCFAVLNDRYWASKKDKSVAATNLKSVMNLLADFRNRTTLEARLLQHGSPILISNRTDPFGRANRAAALPVLRVLREMEIPVAIQTKGFTKPDDFEEVMEILDYPTAWYISIASLSEEYRAKVEPGAPSIQHRLDLISKLREQGHEVVVGINPCVPEWNDKPEQLCREISDRGAWGVWVEALHLSRDQRNQLTEREKTNLTEEIIIRSGQRGGIHPIDDEHCEITKKIAVDMGLQPFSIGQAIPSRFFDVYHACYEKTFPTQQDFLNACCETLEEGDLILFEDWLGFMSPYLPEGVMGVGHYLGATSRKFVTSQKGKWSNYMSYPDLLKMIWANDTISFSPVNHDCFSYATAKDGNESVTLTDDDGLPILIFSKNGWNHYYVDVDDFDVFLSAA